MVSKIIKEKIIQYIQVYGGCTSNDLIESLGMYSPQIYNGLCELVKEERIQKFKITFNRGRHLGQHYVFTNIKRQYNWYFYYTDKKRFLKWFAKQINPNISDFGLVAMFHKKLSTKEIDIIINYRKP